MLEELRSKRKLFEMLARDDKGFLLLKGKVPQQRGRVADNVLSLNDVESLITNGGNVNQLGVFLAENLIRIDLDDIVGKEKYIEHSLPDTTIFKTKRGYHLFFKVNSTTGYKKGDYLLYNQLECEIIPSLPKSTAVLPFNDEDREIINDSEPIQLPLEWDIQKKIKRGEKVLPVSEGSRDETLFKIACVLKDKFNSPDILTAINKYAVYPPMDDDAVINKWDSATSYSPAPVYDADNPLTDKKGNPLYINIVDAIIDRYDIKIMVEGKAQVPFMWDGSYWRMCGELEIKDIIPNFLDDKNITVNHKSNIYKLLLEDPRIRCRLSDFNKNTRMVFLDDTVYNLSTAKFEPHTKHNMNTYKIPHKVNSSSNIVHPKDSVWFKEFVSRTDLRKDDVMMLLEYIAYCLVPTQHLKCSLFLTGPTNTGKSVLIKQIGHLLGEDNISSVSMHALNARFMQTELFNKLLNEDGDGGSNTLKDIGSFKKMTGGEKLRHEDKGEKAFNFNPFCKNIFSFNKLPLQQDENTDAFYGRLRIIELKKKMILEDHLVQEVLVPALVELLPYLITEVLPAIYYKGISRSAVSQLHVNQLFGASDPLQEILNEYVIEEDGALMPKKELYEFYSDKCLEWEERPVKYREFIREMRAKGIYDVNDENGEACYMDLKFFKVGD